MQSMTNYVTACPNQGSLEHTKTYSEDEKQRQVGHEEKVVTILRMEKHSEDRVEEPDKRTHGSTLRKTSADPRWIIFVSGHIGKQNISIPIRRCLMWVRCDTLAHVNLSISGGFAWIVVERLGCITQLIN